MREKEKLVEYIKNNVYCRLKPSPIHGVGTFAIRNIPKGTKLFIPFEGEGISNVVKVAKSEFKDYGPKFKEYLNDMMQSNDTKYKMVIPGDNQSHMTYYVNASSNSPNIKFKFVTHPNRWGEYITMRNIEVDEEILMSYSIPITNTNNEEFKNVQN